MLQEIKDKKSQIDVLMQQYGVKEWKLFEDIPNLKFPTTSPDAHFLIIPSERLDLTKMRKLKEAIEDLFPRDLLEFYTPGQLKDLIEQGKLNQQIYDQIMASMTTSADDSKAEKKSLLAETKFFTEAILPVQTSTPPQTTVTIDITQLQPSVIAEIVQRRIELLGSFDEKKAFLVQCQDSLSSLNPSQVPNKSM